VSLDRRLAGTSLVVGPALGVLGTALHPARKGDEAEHLASVSANLDRWYAAHVLFVLALLLAVPSILALVQLVGVRRRGWAQTGGALAFVGLVAVTPVIAWEFVIWEMAKPGRDPGEMVALLERINTAPGLVPFYVASLAFPAGFVALALGLWRTGSAPGWQALALGGGYVVFFAGGLATATVVVPLGGALAILAGSAPIGRRLLASPDTDAAGGALAPT
jgi:hypothetical protein